MCADIHVTTIVLWAMKHEVRLVRRIQVTCLQFVTSVHVNLVTLFTSQSGDERIAIERRAREVAEERLRRVMQEAEAR